MAETIQEARMQQKHDVAENWNEASGFIPRAGEIIIYDKDISTSKQRMKVGDGENSAESLSFITGEVYAQKAEPQDAGEGAIWITADGAQKGEESEDPEAGNTKIELDTTLTKSGMAADSKAVGDAIKRIPVEVGIDGYTEITNLRRPTNIAVVKNSEVSTTITTTLEGSTTSVIQITLDSNGFPTKINTDGNICNVTWRGFDE